MHAFVTNTTLSFIKSIMNKISRLLNRGNERSVKAKKNILLMLLYKGGNIIIGLLLVPLTIHYVDSVNYGIWLTLSSMITWMSFFDIGINNGLKNRLTEALAKGDYTLGKEYVSTTYAVQSLIFMPLMIILLFIASYIDWSSLLNISETYEGTLLRSVYVIIAYFCLNFIFSTINVIILAEQRPADSALRTFLQQLCSLVVIYILTRTITGNLFILCLALCLVPLSVVILFNVTLFGGRYRNISPSISSVKFSLVPDLMKLGMQFFIIQIAAIIQYQMINFLIMRYYGASEVTEYNIAFKYFSILTMVWGILTTPIWAAVTDAMTKGEWTWIKNVQTKYLKVFSLFFLLGIVMLCVSTWVYDMWIGGDVAIPFDLSLAVLIYNMVMMYGGIFVAVVNGSGQLKIQTYASIMSPFVFIGTFFLFSRVLNIGIISIIIAAIVSNFNGLVLAPIQCKKMLLISNR